MNATELVNQYYTWKDNGSDPNKETATIYAGNLIASHGLVGALVQCVQYGLEDKFEYSYFMRNVSKAIISAANA